MHGFTMAAIAALTLTTSACTDVVGPRIPADRVETRRIDVGGYRLQVQRTGTSGRTVVFLAGLGEPQATWQAIPASVREFARVVTYDRGGVGASDAAPGPRTAAAVADELLTLLDALGISGRVVLVGHSLGALHMQHFAQRHPSRVAGLVFIDGTPAALTQLIAESVPPGVTLEQMLNAIADDMQLTGGARSEFVAQVTSGQQVLGAGKLPNVPVHVLTSMKVIAPDTPAGRQMWFEAHAEWVRQVSRGTHVGLADAGHHIHWDAPAAVVSAIRSVVAAAE